MTAVYCHGSGGNWLIFSTTTNLCLPAEPLTYSIDSPSRQNGKHGLLSKWQTVRARSPLACLAQSQAAVLSRPKIPNVSKRLSGYLPLSSTCPSLQSVQNSTKPHRLSACGIHSNKNNNQREVAVPRKTPSTERFETPKPLEAKLALLTPNGDENSLQEQEDPPSRSDSQKSFISKSRNTEPHTPVKSAQAGEDKRQKTVQSPSLGGSQSELLINKTRCKLPLRYRNIRRNLDESRHGPNQPSSSTRPQKDTTVEAAIAQLEATPKQPIPLAPSQIGNAIDHFESLIAGDRIYPKQKHSLRRKFRIPVSRSCQVTKPDSQPKPGVAEETRRKFSNSWGPARWRKGLIGHHTKNGQPEASREPPDVSHGSRRCEGHHIPTDGSADGRHSLSRLWDPRDERLNNLEHESITAVPDLYVNAGSRLEYDAQRLQVGSTDIGCNVTRMEQEHVGIQAGRRSWRFSGRRWMSRSSVPLIARADCTLEQPRPVRVNEIKRLVSLCREKVTGRKTRPQTD